MTLRKTLFTLLFIAFLPSAKAQITSVQFINNSGDAAAFSLNIYIDGILKITSLQFRNSSAFLNVDAGVPVTISVSDDVGTVQDTFYSITTTFSTNPIIKYVCVANGIRSATGYSPKKPFGLSIFNLAREISLVAGNTDVVFMHGCTDDAGTYDIRSGTKILADDLVYGEFSSDYTEMPNSAYKFRITNPSGSQLARTYITDFSIYPDFTDKPAMILFSGFKNPSNNSNGPAFGLWAATATAGPLIEIDSTEYPEAITRLQIAHNSADTALDSVDVYINNQLRYDNFGFRTATPYIDLIGYTNTKISIAKKNSSSVADTFFSFSAVLDSAKTYLAIINGLKSSGYTPSQPFTLHFNTKAREETTAGNIAIQAFNGSTDAPDLKITEGTNTFVNNLPYGNYIPGYTFLTTTDTLFVLGKSIVTGPDTIHRYDADMQTLGFDGQAVTLVASGFFDTTKNKASPLFGLYWIKPSGGNFIPLTVNTTPIGILAYTKDLFRIYPNPANNQLHLQGNIDFNLANAMIFDVAGRLVKTVPDLSSKQVNISSLTNGIYFLKMSLGNEYGYQKFIKE